MAGWPIQRVAPVLPDRLNCALFAFPGFAVDGVQKLIGGEVFRAEIARA
jgi:hypothetical protein